MEESSTRRREVYTPTNINTSTIYEDLAILLGSRTIITLSADPISVCFRAGILSELVLKDKVKLNNNNELIVVDNDQNMDDLCIYGLKQIRKKNYSIKKWLRLLNGENFSPTERYQLKKVRHNIYKKLEERNIVRFEDSFCIKKVIFIDNESVNRTKDFFVNQFQNDNYLYRDIITCLLHVCGAKDLIKVTLPILKQQEIAEKMENIIEKYKRYYKRDDQKEDMIAQLMKALLSRS